MAQQKLIANRSTQQGEHPACAARSEKCRAGSGAVINASSNFATGRRWVADFAYSCGPGATRTLMFFISGWLLCEL